MANDTSFGLSAAIFTRDNEAAMRFASESTAGMVHINGPTVQEEPLVPFGGTGESGFGRESADEALENYTEWKWITMNTP